MSTDRDYSGKVMLRIPSSLHRELARQAEQEGVSLNQFAAAALAGAVGWRRRGAIDSERAAEPVGRR